MENPDIFRESGPDKSKRMVTHRESEASFTWGLFLLLCVLYPAWARAGRTGLQSFCVPTSSSFAPGAACFIIGSHFESGQGVRLARKMQAGSTATKG